MLRELTKLFFRILNTDGVASTAFWTFIFEVTKGISGKIEVLQLIILGSSYFRCSKIGWFGLLSQTTLGTS